MGQQMPSCAELKGSLLLMNPTPCLGLLLFLVHANICQPNICSKQAELLLLCTTLLCTLTKA